MRGSNQEVGGVASGEMAKIFINKYREKYVLKVKQKDKDKTQDDNKNSKNNKNNENDKNNGNNGNKKG